MNRSYSRRGLGLILLFLIGAGTLSAADDRPRILIIGATAKSSKQIISQALERGYDVVGLARRPEAVSVEHERFRVVKGDVYELATLEAAMTGREVVISMIAPRFSPDEEIGEVDLFTVGTGNIIEAMKRQGNRRFLVASSLAVEEDVPDTKPTGDNMGRMWVWNARFLYRDMANMETMVRESGLDYVVFRPPFLVEEAMQDDIKISVGKHSPKGRILAYADFARFVLDQVESGEHIGQVVGLYSDRKLQWGENVDFETLAEEARASKALEETNQK